MLKSILRSNIGRRCFGWLIASIIAVLMYSIRWRQSDRLALRAIVGNASNKVCNADGSPIQSGVIMVFWHERLLAMPYLWPRGFALHALQSSHADGQMMSYAIRCFGVKTIWGSTNRSATEGLRGLIKVLKKGDSVAMTPDGPRGPAREAALGPIALARLTGVPILPVCWSTDRLWRGSGWDKLMIPKPFSRGRLLVGDLIYIDHRHNAKTINDAPMAVSASDGRELLENARLKMQQALSDLGEQADKLTQPK